MAANDKDTIYVDIDDEITAIIDKVKGSNGKVVALVLPKRAAVLQSIVNMKLLKRAADEIKKSLVLITAEAGLMPLAGAAGVYVAKTLNSKPEIPLGPEDISDDDEAVDEDELPAEELTAENAGDRPVGELAAAGAAGAVAGAAASKAADNEVETLELDDDETPEETAAASEKAAPSPKSKKDSKLKVPNFNRFRLMLIAGAVLLILLIVGGVFGLSVLPKATINIKTDASNVPISLNFTASTTATTSSAGSHTVPAKQVQQQKTYSQQVTTTGSKNNGTKAQGNVTMTAQECGTPQPAADVPAGAGVTANGQTYITQQDTSFGVSKIKNGCIYFQATSDTPITAQSAGTSFNVSGVNFTVVGRSDISASGSASGGTDNIQQVVSAGDISNAKSKISTTDTSIQQALESQLKGESYYPISTTFSSGTPTTTTSANVGDAASTVTVTETVTYTMIGVEQSALQSLLDQSIKGQIDTSTQNILDNGLSSATFSVNTTSANSTALTLSTNAVAGPELNVATIKQQAMGKKPGDVETQIKNNPDVTNVNVKLSPFWVSSVPSKASKITVTIAKPTKTESQGSGGNQ